MCGPRLFALLLIFVLSTPLAAQDVEKPIITMQRTYCFGSCPVYSLEIYLDGTVIYEGKAFVAVKERRVTKISQAQVRDLIRSFLAINYFSLKNSYRYKKNPDGTMTTPTDLPTTYTSFTYGGRSKSIGNYAFAPRKLDALQNKIDRAVNFHQWWHGQHDLKDWRIVEEDVYSGIKPGQTKLMRASIEWDAGQLQKEIAAGGDVNARDESGWTALMLAAERCRLASVKLLLGSGAQVKARDQNGDTALMGVASGFCYHEEEHKGRVSIIRSLILAGADTNEVNNTGETPLMAAADSGSLEAVETLLAMGADIHLRDKKGKNALDHAKDALPKLARTSLKERSAKILSILEKAIRNR